MSKRLPGAPPALAGHSYVRPLGVGGFADVFLFEQDMPRRSVAVKVLLQSVVDSEVLRMFNAEADVLARLSAHPSILTVFDASISADGRPYIVMEYCPGSFSTRYRSEYIPVAEVLTVGVKVASALETAHRAGLLHRDIKPSNLLVNTFGTPVLGDFGIAASVASVTGTDNFAMSIPWSAPEVVENRVSGSVATEIWGLGSTLYTLLAGRTPFEVEGAGRNSAEQLTARISRARYSQIPRQDVPDLLQRLLARTMERDPAKRQSSMLELAQELQYVQQQLGLVPTALEVAADDWNTASSEVDFNNTQLRGPVISTVQHESKRTRPTRTAPIGRTATGDSTIFGPATPAPRRSKAVLGIAIAVGVVVVLAATAIVAAIVISGMQ